MAQNNYCTDCALATGNAAATRLHNSTPEHAAAVARRNAIRDAQETLRLARLVRVTDEFGSANALPEHVRYPLYSQNRDLARDLAKLQADLAWTAQRAERDGVAAIAYRGAASVYASSILNAATLAEIEQTTGRVTARREALTVFSHALGARCAAAYDPREWRFLDDVAAALPAQGTNEFGDFVEFSDDAILAGVQAAREAAMARNSAEAVAR